MYYWYLFLQLKEVAPHAVPKDTEVFWKKDIKVNIFIQETYVLFCIIKLFALSSVKNYLHGSRLFCPGWVRMLGDNL